MCKCSKMLFLTLNRLNKWLSMQIGRKIKIGLKGFQSTRFGTFKMWPRLLPNSCWDVKLQVQPTTWSSTTENYRVPCLFTANVSVLNRTSEEGIPVCLQRWLMWLLKEPFFVLSFNVNPQGKTWMFVHPQIRANRSFHTNFGNWNFWQVKCEQ